MAKLCKYIAFTDWNYAGFALIYNKHLLDRPFPLHKFILKLLFFYSSIAVATINTALDVMD